MNKHLNPSSTEAPACLFIADNSSVIVITALSPDFAVKERMYALQMYLNRDLQVKCPDARGCVSVRRAGAARGGGTHRLSGCSVNLPFFPPSFSLGLSAGLPLCLVCGFTPVLSPHSLLVFHLICLKTLPDQLSSKSNLGV